MRKGGCHLQGGKKYCCWATPVSWDADQHTYRYLLRGGTEVPDTKITTQWIPQCIHVLNICCYLAIQVCCSFWKKNTLYLQLTWKVFTTSNMGYTSSSGWFNIDTVGSSPSYLHTKLRNIAIEITSYGYWEHWLVWKNLMEFIMYAYQWKKVCWAKHRISMSFNMQL